MKFNTSSTSSSPQNGTNKEAWHEPLNKVTPLSKVFAAVVVIALPFLGFFLGMYYAAYQGGAAVIQALGL